MSMELYRKILDEAADIPLITQVCITGLGEPTLDARLPDRAAYARAKKPKAWIDVFSNGVHMTPRKFDDLKPHLSCVVFSLNAVSAEQHEAQMGLKGKFDTVCANIDYAIAHRNGTRVEVRAVLGPEWTEDQAHAFYQRWGNRNRGGHGMLIHEGNWADGNRTTRSFKPNEACARALGQIYVTWDGKVTSCCFDPGGEQVFGDLNKQTIREVYGSDEYVRFRRTHFEDRADEYGICAKCTRI